MNGIRLLLVACAVLAARAGTAATPAGSRSADQEKLEAAADNIARVRAAVKVVLGRAEEARSEKDVVKLNCVNEKLTQMKALLEMAEQADGALRESLASRTSAGEAEFSKVAIARTKVDGLRREAEQCVGQLAYIGEDGTTVEVERPAWLERDDTGLGVAKRGENAAEGVGRIGADPGPPFVPPPLVRPPAASPYR